MGRSFWVADWWPIMAIGLVGFASLLFSVIAYLASRRANRRRPLRSASLILLACISFLVLFLAGVFLIQFGGYHTLTEWEVVARVKCSSTDKFGKFELTYTTLAGGQERGTRQYEIYGDRWFIRADMVVWKPFMSRLGFRKSFKFSRLDGVYNRRQDTLEHPLSGNALAGGSDKIWLRFHHSQPRWPFKYFLQSVYTSAVSNRPDPGVLYDIVGAKEGIALRKVNY